MLMMYASKAACMLKMKSDKCCKKYSSYYLLFCIHGQLKSEFQRASWLCWIM